MRQEQQVFTIDWADGPRGAVSIAVPAGLSAFPDVLPAIRTVADVILERSRAGLGELGRSVSCGKGCSVCCHHLVMMGEAEALLLCETLARLPEPRRSAVTRRFRAGLARLEEAGLLPEFIRVFRIQAPVGPEVGRLQEAYWRLRIPCPFLEDGACGIYQERPLICRQYAVTTPPAACAAPYDPGTYLEKVLVPIDFAGAAAAFGGALATTSRALPHLFCLFRERELRKRVWPKLPAADALSRFFDYAQMCYGRKD